MMSFLSLFRKHFFKALGFTIIFFGSSHLVVSYILMLTRDIDEGNLFRILNYQKLLPGIDYGTTSFVISNIIAVAGFFVAFGLVVYFDNKKQRKAAEATTEAAEAKNSPRKKSTKTKK